MPVPGIAEHGRENKEGREGEKDRVIPSRPSSSTSAPPPTPCSSQSLTQHLQSQSWTAQGKCGAGCYPMMMERGPASSALLSKTCPRT
eukprot:696709-Rhodomonas_salina.2